MTRGLLAAFALLLAAPAAAMDGPDISTADVDRFFAVYDAARGHPTAADLQSHYIDPGSQGLHDFVKIKEVPADRLAAAIEKKPATFERARSCASVLPRVRQRLVVALAKLHALYPPATFPPITIVIGRGATGGTTSHAGVLIGLETLCSADYLEPNIEDRFVHLIAHEYGHVQQPGADDTDMAGVTLLYAAEIEGGAEFVGELISGSVSYPHLRVWTKGHEAEIESRFDAERNGTKLDDWLYNGPGDPTHPGDLAYWMGYRIARGYYDRATDKKQALADILTVSRTTAESLYRQSGLATR